MRKLLDDILSSLWFRPGLWMLIYTVLALTLVYGELQLHAGEFDRSRYELLRIDAAGARTMLGAIATAMLTVTSLTFSVIMLAVVQTANAYSPRLLRRYIRDPLNQHALGILLGTFLYSMVVLRSIWSREEFVPFIATNVAVALSFVATAALLYSLNHVPQSIKVSSIISLIIEQTETVIARGFPRDVGRAWEGEGEPKLPEGAPHELLAGSSGYMQHFDHEKLLPAAERAGVVIRMHWIIGDYVLAGTPLASVWGKVDAELEDMIERACMRGSERSSPQDAEFGLDQITDIAVRALSPGVNDPATAATAIDALTYLLRKYLVHEVATPYRCDLHGQLRLVLPGWSFGEMIEDGYLRILQYGGQDVLVVRQLLRACEQLSHVARGEAERELLWALVEAVHAHALAAFSGPNQRRQIDRLIEHTTKELGRPPLPSLSANP
ncbi:hypothetical protein DB30_08024 [Enhygromyxa salina]|uniref:DUF2254 domain-containing protein n=1 Tax=Enhygromyxa salina TaxID=215803 RepID=A0A0C2D033_9BACT|nr:DUF2254 domain-containing protein [Enhygromyxa salina]KIG13512.1 hypothetical protein DB30_08024 [Enhygromyxa salina]